MAHIEIDSLGELLTSTTIEVCERLAIPYKSSNINIVQLDLDIRETVPALAKLMWDYFYAHHRHQFYFNAIEQNHQWASQEELTLRESELTTKKNIFYEQLELFTSMNEKSNRLIVATQVISQNRSSDF